MRGIFSHRAPASIVAVTIRAVTAAETRPLRHAVLRPHQRPEELVYESDDAPDTLHAAAIEAGEIVGTATIARAPHPGDPGPADWRIRGMATAPAARGRGIGAALLQACLDHARERGGGRVWCNARTPAIALYERAGFAVEGEEFELPDIGPHVVMSRDL
jgi:ribosomal protein S18 acetylase RimI-like enzyme